MFYDGDLQSGISLAIQEQKLVACFVRRDDDEQSAIWENEWLQAPLGGQTGGSDTTLGGLLAEKAVLLRLEAGSKEAGFLSAFCSLDQVPKLVIINNGTVLEDIEGGISREDFSARITSRLGYESAQEGASKASSSSKQPTVEDSKPEPQVLDTPATATQPLQPATSPPERSDSRVQSLLAERSARLEQERRRQEEAEKEARIAVAKARKEKAKEENTTTSSGTVPKARQDWMEQQRTRQQEAKLERERVLKSIESDKAARREREQQRRLAAQADATGGPGAVSSESVQQSSRTAQRGPSGSAPTQCSLLIRLFDGTSIRSRFSANATLSAAVRTYVSENSGTSIPYNFRQMQTPLPSRTIDITEENESLLSLGLCPSATLVLIPVKGFQEAYKVSGGRGIISGGITMTYHMLNGAYGIVNGILGRVTAYGGAATTDGPYVAGTADEQEPSNVEGSKMAEQSKSAGPSSGIKIRTLADQRREEKTPEFYNGNQLSTEPRKKDDDDAQ